jgi:hypothetical protein
MAINLEPSQGASAPLAGRLDRQDAEARQDRWMMELERAMFSSGAKKQRAALPQQADGPAQQESVRPAGAEAVAAIAGRRAAGAASAAPAEGRDAETPQAASAAAGRTAGVQAAQDDSVERDTAAPHAGGQGGLAAGLALPGHAPAGAQTLAAATGAEEGAAASASAVDVAAGASARLAAAAGSAQEMSVQTVQTVQATQQLTASLAGPGQAAEPVLDGGTPAGLGPEMAEQADTGAAARAEPTEFDKRLMHLYAGPDGMHAYIRDAELGAAQMRSVAAALSTELAASGQSLTTLTVNGKRIGLVARDVPGATADADEADPIAGDDPAGSRPTLSSLSLVRKEASE